MKYKTNERYETIFNWWYVDKLSFEQISRMSIPSFLSLQRIRNIVYGGPQRLTTDHQRAIYKLFRIKFLELQDTDASIRYVHEHQPETTIHEDTVRRIVRHQLKQRALKSQRNHV